MPQVRPELPPQPVFFLNVGGALVFCCACFCAASSQTRALCSSLLPLFLPTAPSPGVIACALMDALVACGRHRRAALLLSACLQANLCFSDAQSPDTPTSGDLSSSYEVARCTDTAWWLDVRHLSLGGAVVALRQWLAKLMCLMEEEQGKFTRQATSTEETQVPSSEHTAAQPSVAISSDDKAQCLPEVLVQLMPSNPFIRGAHSGLSLAQSVERIWHPRRDRQLLLVTGWGQAGKCRGESKVRQAVAAELKRLQLPFRPVMQGQQSGRWELGEAELRHWWEERGAEAVRLLVLRDRDWGSGCGKLEFHSLFPEMKDEPRLQDAGDCA